MLIAIIKNKNKKLLSIYHMVIMSRKAYLFSLLYELY